MIPTYNAGTLLEETLRSVLAQDPGPDAMQIAVVDDRSPDGEAERVVARVAPGRVEFHRNAENLRLAGNWNRCLELARGRWVHLLHQDDTVRPGFYERLGDATRIRPDLGAAFCRTAYLGALRPPGRETELLRETPGVLDDWLWTIATGQRLECPSIVVRREVYERIGGFLPELRYALDWEMWVRIAASYPVWYEPEALACYRRHGANETARLQESGEDLPDIILGLDLIARSVPPARRAAARREAERLMIWRWMGEANRLMASGRRLEALAQVRRAYRNQAAWPRVRALLGYSRWALGSWVGERLARAGRRNEMRIG